MEGKFKQVCPLGYRVLGGGGTKDASEEGVSVMMKCLGKVLAYCGTRTG